MQGRVGLAVVGAVVAAVALPALAADSSDPSLAILRRPYRATDRLPRAVRVPPHRPRSSRLAWDRYNVRFYVVALRRKGGVCLIQVRMKSGKYASGGMACNALATITRYGAILTASRRVEGVPATWAGIVADGYTRASLGGHVGHVRNNVFHLRTRRLHGVLHV
ncbi:MAG: hypothetical protein QOJ29_3365, partial [Thermoleophilaceae bacterium]|nr:hypothetical protein [Thermoleophilaceae bacterium]